MSAIYVLLLLIDTTGRVRCLVDLNRAVDSHRPSVQHHDRSRSGSHPTSSDTRASFGLRSGDAELWFDADDNPGGRDVNETLLGVYGHRLSAELDRDYFEVDSQRTTVGTSRLLTDGMAAALASRRREQRLLRQAMSRRSMRIRDTSKVLSSTTVGVSTINTTFAFQPSRGIKLRLRSRRCKLLADVRSHCAVLKFRLLTNRPKFAALNTLSRELGAHGKTDRHHYAIRRHRFDDIGETSVLFRQEPEGGKTRPRHVRLDPRKSSVVPFPTRHRRLGGDSLHRKDSLRHPNREWKLEEMPSLYGDDRRLSTRRRVIAGQQWMEHSMKRFHQRRPDSASVGEKYQSGDHVSEYQLYLK